MRVILYFSMHQGFLIAQSVHMLSALMLFVGIVLFIIWAGKHMKKDQLKTLSLSCIAIGLVLGGLTAGFLMSGHGSSEGKYRGAKTNDDIMMQVLSERGVTFTEEEWDNIHKEMREQMIGKAKGGMMKIMMDDADETKE